MTAALTRQETFDKAAAGLLAQRAKSVNKKGTCCYRGLHGSKCAAGFLIADEHYSEELEGTRVGAYSVRHALKKSGVTDVELAYIMQRVHDGYSPERWPEELGRLARSENLLPYPRNAV